jgi:succinate dehydrogenase/fumarate reductase flavoprotein subunit
MRAVVVGAGMAGLRAAEANQHYRSLIATSVASGA